MDLEHRITDAITAANTIYCTDAPSSAPRECALCGGDLVLLHFRLGAGARRGGPFRNRPVVELALCFECVEEIAALHIMNRHLWVARREEAHARLLARRAGG